MRAVAESWIDRFPGLMSLPAELQADLVGGSEVISLPRGTTIFRPGEAADRLALAARRHDLRHAKIRNWPGRHALPGQRRGQLHSDDGLRAGL